MALQLKDIAKALGVTPQYIATLVRKGMPITSIEEAKAWRDAQVDGREKPAPKAKVTPDSLDDGTLKTTIEQHRRLVSQAQGVWEASMDQGDSNQGKYQTAYNASLKTLMALEDEQKVRLKESRDFIKREEAEEAMRLLMGEVLAVLDKLGLDCAEKCNPDNPAMAVKALEAWVRSARNILSKDETQKDA